MKNLIRKWLGIVEVKPMSDRELRKMIGEAVVDALSGASDERWALWCLPTGFGSTLTSALEEASKGTAKSVAAKLIEERIGGETFIDEVIDRIRRKQLSA